MDCSPWDHKELDTTEQLTFFAFRFRQRRGIYLPGPGIELRQCEGKRM